MKLNGWQRLWFSSFILSTVFITAYKWGDYGPVEVSVSEILDNLRVSDPDTKIAKAAFEKGANDVTLVSRDGVIYEFPNNLPDADVLRVMEKIIIAQKDAKRSAFVTKCAHFYGRWVMAWLFILCCGYSVSWIRRGFLNKSTSF